MDRDLPFGEFDRLNGTGQGIGPSSTDLDRAVRGGRWVIVRSDRAALRGRRLSLGAGPSDGVSSPSRSSVVEVAPKQKVAL